MPAAVVCLCLCRLGQVLVYSKIRAALGISNAVVSGGGSLPPALDDWYEAIGLPVLNGWGLTEVGLVDMLEHWSPSAEWLGPDRGGAF